MRAALLVLVACTHAPEPAKPPPPPPADARAIDAALPADARPIDAAPDAAVAQVEPPDALVVALPVARSCPKHYADVAKTSCVLDDAYKLACKYPDGHCECVQQQPCAGWAGAYEEAKKHPHAVWVCTPKVRDDGCPGDQPKEGSRCSKPGQECMFGSCGGAVMSCSGGSWKLDHVMGGPPSAPHH